MIHTRLIAAALNYTLFLCAPWCLPAALLAQSVDDGRDHLIVPAGFQVRLYADDALAHDIFCMTTDSQGRIVVSGPGYIKILEDSNQDHRADTAITFANGPIEGAQGLYFDGPDLLCIGNEGLLRYVDRDQNGQADTAPQLMLKLPTGGEHNTHAIHRGPDGDWYIIAGNSSGIDQRYATLKTSPLKTARAGVILRLNATLSGGEIFAEGFRNAYDFDFTHDGEILSYDSDGERDMTLPWYRPCRLFHTTTASDQGWLSLHWKQPDYALEISPVVSQTGRGSPTGLIAYRHRLFPENYRNAVFGLDWTFGKIWSFHLDRAGSTYRCETELFAKANGNFGFAPTSGVVGKDGALYVAVGGRGTQGAVYRIAPTPVPEEIDSQTDPEQITDFVPPIRLSPPAATTKSVPIEQPRLPIITPGALTKAQLATTPSQPIRLARHEETKISEAVPKTEVVLTTGISDAGTTPELMPAESASSASESIVISDVPTTLVSRVEPNFARFYAPALMDVLDAPQPLASWSRQQWVAKALVLREPAFIAAALDDQLTTPQRMRAIEVLTELFAGPDQDMMARFSLDPSPLIRARAIWAWGRTFPTDPQRDVIKPFLLDQDAWVARCAWETLLTVDATTLNVFTLELAKALSHSDRQVRLLATRLAIRLGEREFRTLSAEAVKGGWSAALHVALAYAARTGKVNPYALNIGTQILKNNELSAMHLDAVLLIQSAVGTVGPTPGVVPVFESYTAAYNLEQRERDLDPVRIQLAEIYPTTDPLVNHEIVRTFAMLKTYNGQIVSELLSQITTATDPTEDIHILIALGAIPADRDLAQLTATAQAFLNLGEKIKARDYVIEAHYEDRMEEVYTAHCAISPALPDVIIAQPEFGQPDHVRYLAQIREESIETAFDAFVNKLMEDPEHYPWTEDAIFILGQTEVPEVLEMIRALSENNTLRPAVLMALSELGDPVDRDLMLSGLSDYQIDVVTACLGYLQADPSLLTSNELAQIYAAARRLDQGEQALQVRSDLMDLLTAKTGQSHGFISGTLGFRDQTVSLNAWRDWLTEQYPSDMQALTGNDPQSLATWMSKLDTIHWASGEAARGQLVFEQAACSRCHGGAKALGPDLAGVSTRFSRADLLTAIVAPNRDVSARYQTITVTTTQGKVYTGLVVYESADGLVLRDASNKTYRIEASEIDARQANSLSLMPEGLIDKLTDEQLADLMAYLESLGQTKIASPAEATTK